jgi:hypothetical protein
MEMGRVEIFEELIRTMNDDGTTALFESVPEGFEFTPDPSFPESGTFTGEELRRWGVAWETAWETVRLELLQTEEEGGAVYSRCRWRAKGAASGVDVPFEEFTMIIWFDREDAPVRGAAFFDHDLAVAALRGSPPPA